RMDARGDRVVALEVAWRLQLVLADPAELGDERALRRVAAEQARDADGVRRELLELRIELPLAAVAPEVPPLVRAPRPHRLWFTASTLLPSGSRTKAPTYPGGTPIALPGRRCRGSRHRWRPDGTPPLSRRSRPGRRGGRPRSAAVRRRLARTTGHPPRRGTA